MDYTRIHAYESLQLIEEGINVVARNLFALFAVFLLSGAAHAFEVKGYTPGMNVSALDLSGCRPVENADSGVPGYACDTTVGGDPALLKLLVFDEKVVGAVFRVKNAQMRPVLDALTEKYGRPIQSNRYIEDYDWRKGKLHMSIKERRIDRGYSILLIDFDLFEVARKAAKDKAKSDL